MRRKNLFWIALIAVPVLFFAGLEATLRILGYDGESGLVVRKMINGTEYYSLNRNAARTYFSQRGISIPELHDDIFSIHKAPGTKRIFMLGESTMAGFPYDYNATAPDLLRDRLRALFPQYAIEVVNVGASAVNSYTTKHFLDEVVRYEPDALVFYFGHNEFYGAFGVGSSEYLGRSRFVIDAYLSLNKLKLFRLLRNCVSGMRSWISSPPSPRQGTLMQAMARDKSILYLSDEYITAKENYEANLREMIATARAHSIPVVLSTLTCNLRDQPPFRSDFSLSTTEGHRSDILSALRSASAAFSQHDFNTAANILRGAIVVDSMYAESHFRLGVCLDSLRDYAAARDEYSKARDNDALRFRATSDFNTMIRDVASSEGSTLADGESAFEQASEHGLVGRSLMLEHLHPNFEGYFLLAKTFCSALLQIPPFSLPEAAERAKYLADSTLKKASAVTPFDLEAGLERVAELTRSWPFVTQSEPAPARVRTDFLGRLTYKYVHKQIAWSEGHYELGDWYISRSLYDSAFTDYLAVGKVIPYSYLPYMKMGDVYRYKNNADSAVALYLRGLGIENSPFLHVRLGMIYFDRNEYAKAILEFEATLDAGQNGGETMDVKSRSMARFFLGAAYGKSGNIPLAKTNLQTAVQLNPGNEEARKMLEQLK